MSNIKSLEFTALDLSGRNYLSWVQDVEIHLDGMNLGHTIEENNTASLEETAKAMIFIRRHIHEDLKSEYLTVRDPKILWNELKERFEHQKTIILPKALYDWGHIRLQDFVTVQEYYSALFKIVSFLRLCGETITEANLLEKTFSTMHPNDITVQRLYRRSGFTKFSELITCLLVAEKNDEILLKNHQLRPTGATPVPPEANKVSFKNRRQGYNRGYARGRGRHSYRQNRGGFVQRPFNRKRQAQLQNWNENSEQPHKFIKTSHQSGSQDPQSSKGKGKGILNNPPTKNEDKCFRCGIGGHWARTCRTPKHLTDLYQESIKKGKGIEVNFADQNEPFDNTCLDIEDFITEPDESFDFLTGN